MARITVYVSEAVKRDLDREAAMSGMSLSKWARRKLVGMMARPAAGDLAEAHRPAAGDLAEAHRRWYWGERAEERLGCSSGGSG
jgi:hypothetical protein